MQACTGQPAQGAPLFLVHDETCCAEHLASMTRHLSGVTAVFPLPGFAPPALRTVQGTALRLVRRIRAVQPRGPYRIAGWGLGGVLAYEAAGLLLGRDEPVEFLGIVHPHGSPPGDAGDAGAECAHRQAVRRYVPPPLPVTIHLFAEEEASGGGPWRAWGTAEPGAAIRTVSVPRLDGRALAGAVGREIRRAAESAPSTPEERLSPVFPLRFRGSRAPVYCIPGAGASVVGLADLAACIAPGRPVYGLEPRGMDGTSLPHTSVEAAADHYLARIEDAPAGGSLHLVGHSFGGWVAFEMALRLHAAGRPAESLTLIDSSVPDAEDAFIREHDGEEAFLSLVEVVELTAERELGIDPEEIRTLEEGARLRLLHGRMVHLGLVPPRSAPSMLTGPFRVFSACLRTAYRPRASYPRPTRLVLLRDPRLDLEADQLRVSDVVRRWRHWLPDARATVGPGNHMTALKRPHVEQLVSLLPFEA